MLRVIDLFSGVGGLSLGAARAGYHLLGAIEWDKIAIETHNKNFPRTSHARLDLSAVGAKELTESLGIKPKHIDGIVGGPPCQGFSSIGKRVADDKRNDLFIKFLSIVRQIEPRFFVVENVPGILNDRFKCTREAGLRLIEDRYDVAGPLLVNATDFGAPTLRTRVFFIGILKKENAPVHGDLFLPPAKMERVFVGAALRGLPSKIDPDWQEEAQGWRRINVTASSRYMDKMLDHVPRDIGDPDSLSALRHDRLVSGFLGTRHTPEVVKRFARLLPGEIDGPSRAVRLDPKNYCPTLRAGTGPDRGSYQAVRPIHPKEPRVITPREAARLQGFPDWFQFHPTKWHAFRQIGNSVSPIVAEHLLRQVRKCLKDG